MSLFLSFISLIQSTASFKVPLGSTNWCSYKRAKAAGFGKIYKDKDSLQLDIVRMIKPNVERVTSKDMLRKFVYGKTEKSRVINQDDLLTVSEGSLRWKDNKRVAIGCDGCCCVILTGHFNTNEHRAWKDVAKHQKRREFWQIADYNMR